jgi:3-hydroxyisobutyrate dehydrogenase-like beta-hydroxyacid dehydrogenase
VHGFLAIGGRGHMGMNMAWRLLDTKHRVVAWDRNLSKKEDMDRQGAIPCRYLGIKTVTRILSLFQRS